MIFRVAGVLTSCRRRGSGAELVFHVDASQIVGLSDDDQIETWEDLVGSNDATQSSPIVRPVYKTDVQNGLSIVRTNSSEVGTGFETDLNITMPYTIVIVANQTSHAFTRLIQSRDVDVIMAFSRPSNAVQLNGDVVSSTNVDNKWSIGVLRVSAENGARFMLNKADLTENSATQLDWERLAIGGAGLGLEAPDADFGEIRVYVGDMSDSELEDLNDSLATKWDITFTYTANGQGSLEGYTNPGSGATAPPQLNVSFPPGALAAAQADYIDIEFFIDQGVTSLSQVFRLSNTPDGSSIHVDVSAYSAESDMGDALSAAVYDWAVNSNGIASFSAGGSGADINFTLSSTGASERLEATTTFFSEINISGGGFGADANPPSGETAEVLLVAGVPGKAITVNSISYEADNIIGFGTTFEVYWEDGEAVLAETFAGLTAGFTDDFDTIANAVGPVGSNLMARMTDVTPTGTDVLIIVEGTIPSF